MEQYTYPSLNNIEQYLLFPNIKRPTVFRMHIFHNIYYVFCMYTNLCMFLYV